MDRQLVVRMSAAGTLHLARRIDGRVVDRMICGTWGREGKPMRPQTWAQSLNYRCKRCAKLAEGPTE